MREIGSIAILLHRDIIAIVLFFTVVYLVFLAVWGAVSGFYRDLLTQGNKMGRIEPSLVVKAFSELELTPSLNNAWETGEATAIFAVSKLTGVGFQAHGQEAVCLSKFAVQMGLSNGYIEGYNAGWAGKWGSGQGYEDAIEARRLLSWEPKR